MKLRYIKSILHCRSSLLPSYCIFAHFQAILRREAHRFCFIPKNKAGYTANTSCGRVGRGGYAHFHTFRLVFTDRPTNRRTNGRTDKASYRVACPQLKIDKSDQLIAMPFKPNSAIYGIRMMSANVRQQSSFIEIVKNLKDASMESFHSL